MDMVQSVAAAIWGVVGAEAAGGEGVAKVLGVLGADFDYGASVGFRMLGAFEYRYRVVLLGLFVWVPTVG